MSASSSARSYGSGARILSIGIASTGVLTLAYFAIAGHLLDRDGRVSAQYSHLDVLWSVMFVIISVIYRPIEQLLSRTIAERRARGHAEHTVSEMARCAQRHLLVSVPREPLWRMLNMARGAYWPALGNTPGHLNHWSRSSFVKLLSRHGEVVEVRSPFPWTMVLVRV